MKQTRPIVGLALFHATNLKEDPARIAKLVAAVNAETGVRDLHYIHGQLASSGRFSRSQQLSDANFRLMRDNAGTGVYRALTFEEFAPSLQERREDSASLHVQLAADPNPRVGSTVLPMLPYRVHAVLPQHPAWDAPRVQRCVSAMVRELGPVYGFVTLETSVRDVLMDVTSVPMFPWGQSMSASDVRRAERLHRCQVERVRIGQRACGAFWGNILSAEIVLALGGPERLAREAPVARVSALSEEHWYLQLTSELPRPDDPEYRRALEVLETYLAPATL